MRIKEGVKKEKDREALQRGLWGRLAKLAKALEDPSPGWGIDHIDIELGQLEDVETLAKLLRPILSRATNLRSLSIPIHSSTAKLLGDCGFCDFGEDLNVQKAFQTIFSLNQFTLVRGFSGQLGTEWRSDELQYVEIGKCQLNHESIVRLLKRFKNLVTVKLQGVDLWHHLPLRRKSKLAAIVEALYPSRRNLRELTLNIADSCIASESEVLGIPSLGAFSSLENFTAHESDLSDVIFPPSMIRLGVLSFQREPTFSFFGPDYTSLPKTLRTVLSYSRKPDILQERLEEFPPPGYIEVEIRRYDDSLPRGAIRRPDSPS
ncbi:hypothetical protein N7471_010343 [Penicillium samsonianum]|uniref:uncharacterized protein n=1 Tax=Penicillium samsonianum TaxID=1882272 RepID=UPI00254845E6|nr:uncharacterized protein N7471_010343 [Penicillium samsonianum]KAJ6125850.1 hypothetical protein N7471_010343 [Penicillium samsonianum]